MKPASDLLVLGIKYVQPCPGYFISFVLLLFESKDELDLVVCACNPSTCEMEAGNKEFVLDT